MNKWLLIIGAIFVIAVVATLWSRHRNKQNQDAPDAKLSTKVASAAAAPFSIFS